MANLSNILVHSVQPENVKDYWSQNENVDFVLSFNQRKLIGNSVRIEGDLYCYSDAGTTLLTAATDCKIDAKIGAHGLFSSIVTTFQSSSLGVIESQTEYPRLVKMETDATRSQNDS